MIGRLGGTPEQPAVFFDDAAQFRAWLERHHQERAELWMGLNGAHVVPRGLTWADAVVEALCFGWIDSVSQRIDAASRRQRWTPRRARSTWSLVNVRHAERLIAEGRMTPAGLAAFAARQPERTGVYSFERPEGELRDDERAELEASSRAKAWWEGAPASYRRVVTAWLDGAQRPATRARRWGQVLEDSASGRLIPSQRYGAEPGWAQRLRVTLGLEEPA